MALTDEQIQQYVDTSGIHCPYCDSDNLETGSHDYYGAGVAQNVVCIACGKEWTDDYALVGLTELDDGS